MTAANASELSFDRAPTPAIKEARQFFNPNGEEIFFCEAYGRRPDVTDALRAMGWGKTRSEAVLQAERNWRAAWRSLHPAVNTKTRS